MRLLGILVVIIAILLATATLITTSITPSTEAAEPGEKFMGYNSESDVWTGGNLGKDYIEGDFVSYQLRIDSSSSLWGEPDITIAYDFYVASKKAVFVDGFDTSIETGFQYSVDGEWLIDGQEIPNASWGGIHIPTPEAGEAPGGGAYISMFMDAYDRTGDVYDPSLDGDQTNPASTDTPSVSRAFNVTDIPWGDASSHIILFFRAHLAITIVWDDAMESELPIELDGDEFEDWQTSYFGPGAVPGSNTQFYLTGAAKTIPMPTTEYPTTTIDGYKYVGDGAGGWAPYEGWEINLSGFLELPGLGSIPYDPAPVFTDADGYFYFERIVAGDYTLQEEDKLDYVHWDIVASDEANVTYKDIPGGYVEFHLEREQSMTIWFYNVLATGEINGYKFDDINGNGIWDMGEPGVPGVEITLEGSDGMGNPVSIITTTNSTGGFSFSDLAPGTYWVNETVPVDRVATTSITYGPILLESGDLVELGYVFGNYVPAEITGFKFDDLNGDGIYDGEPGLPGVTITLEGTDGMGNPVSQSTVTDSNGQFWFMDLAPGTYWVNETVPAGRVATTSISQGPIVLESGDIVNLSYVFGNYLPAEIFGYKFDDLNGNGIWDEGEPGVPGVTISLEGTTGMGDTVSDSTTTDGSGCFEFIDLAPGTYWVNETVPVGSVASTTISAGPIVLESKEIVYLGYVFGNYLPAEIFGYKFDDLNGNGIRDEGEPGVPGVTISLEGTTGMGDPVSESTTTDGSGYFEFTDLAPGTYWVNETVPAGSEPSTTISEGPIVLVSGDSVDLSWIFGNYVPAEIIGYKFEDLNGNGMWDEGEPGVSGVPISLEGTDGMGNPVSDSTTTDVSGYFEFTDLAPGTYWVNETVPAGSEPTTAISAGPIFLVSGDSVDLSWIFGNYVPAEITGYKFDDLNGDGIYDGEPGVPGVTITLEGTDGMGNPVSMSTTTDGSGQFWFIDLAPGTYWVNETVPPGAVATTPTSVGPIVLESGELVELGYIFGNYIESSILVFKYEDINGNGVFDGPDEPLTGWGIDLYFDGLLVATATTDGNGQVLFIGLEPGLYTVSEEIRAEWIGTENAIGSVEVIVSSGSQESVTFGNYHVAMITGYKFEDINGNGIWDFGEMGIPDVEITLEGDDGMGYHILMVVLTEADGYFEFAGLAPGLYDVTETVPPGWYPSTPTEVLGISVESWDLIELGHVFGNFMRGDIYGWKFNDLNANGVRDPGEPGIEGVEISLVGVSGMGYAVFLSTFTDVDGLFVFTGIDPGFYDVSEAVPPGWYPSTPTEVLGIILESGGVIDLGYVFGNYIPGDILGWKFDDLNASGVRDPGEPGMAGVEITLEGTDGMGNPVSLSTFTDPDGSFAFIGLVPGIYDVSEIVPVGYLPTTPTEITGLILQSGMIIDLGYAFGNVEMSSWIIYKYYDLNFNGKWDPGEPPLEGWNFTLYDELMNPIVTENTDMDGMVVFHDLMPGIYTVGEELKSGWFNTTPLSHTVEIELGSNYISIFLNAEYGHIHVFKFYDTDLNGEYDGGDYPIAGWNVTLSGAGGSSDYFTNENGWANFSWLKPGTFEVTEEQRTGWFVTTGSYVEIVELMPGETAVVMFGNAELPTITVHKFYDWNLNGEWDDGEDGIEGWNFNVTFSQGISSGVTDENGDWYYGYAWPYFTYLFIEEDRAGWFPTTPTEQEVLYPGPGADIHLYFGNAEYAEIWAYKFNDTNENGEWDDGEEPLPGWTINLMDALEAVIATGVTDGDGRVIFSGLLPGFYYVEEEIPPEWHNVTPKIRLVYLDPGEIEIVEFGNALPVYCLDLIKTGPEEMCWGHEIVWTITVCNCGNEPLRCVKIWDPLTGFKTMIPWLDIGECMSFETSYLVPYGWCEDDWITNTAYAWAWVDEDTNLTAEASHTVFIAKPDIDIEKTGPEYAVPGEVVQYTIIVHNDGNVPLWDVVVSDPLIGLEVFLGFLDVGDYATIVTGFQIPPCWECDYFTNWVTVTAWYYGIYEPRMCFTEDADCHEIEIREASIQVVKTGPESASPGDLVEFEFNVTNTGEVPLCGVYLFDPMLNPEPILLPDLVPGDYVIVHMVYIVPCEGIGDSICNEVHVWGVYNDVQVDGYDRWVLVIVTDPCEEPGGQPPVDGKSIPVAKAEMI
jgi:protocatechuate 3,4-dioxygenase beta subunit